MQTVVEFGAGGLTIEEIVAVAQRRARFRLAADPSVESRLQRSAGHIDAALARGETVYGVNTGYGDSCTTGVPAELVAQLPLNLTRYHGCGLGRILSPEETRAVMAVRLSSLAMGWSGVSLELIRLLTDLLERDILPLIPAEGSVGASGDLTPLSYIAAALVGEREVLFEGRQTPAAEALEKAGLAPLKLKPKEALAIMNGTSVMTGLGALAFVRAMALSDLSTRLTSLTSLGLAGNPDHFDERLHAAKPHPGQVRVAARIRRDLRAFANSPAPLRLQDRYSVRCAPHVIGVLEDMAPTIRAFLETETNSANDNPLFDPEDGRVLHGGHFYGGHICFAMDALKTLVANLADLMDRQLALLVDERFNHGLPSNLSGATGPRAPINHGLKAVQISASAWAAEALKLTMPASVFSRSTECHNQDKVSMGTIAARDALRVIELTEQTAAAHIIACVQAVRLRMRMHDLTQDMLGRPLAGFMEQVGGLIPFIEEDQPLDRLLGELCRLQATGAFRVEFAD